MRALLLSTVFVLPATSAQGLEPPREALQRALDRWRSVHGDAWEAVADESTGFASFVFGGALAPSFAPGSDEDFARLAVESVAATRELHGVEPETLRLDYVRFLPLGLAGTTDKLVVQFRQAVGDVPVRRGFVTVLFDRAGRALSVDSTGLPRLAGLDATPALAAGDARRRAAEAFASDTGMPAQRAGAAELVVEPVVRDGARLGVLAYSVRVERAVPDGQPASFTYRIDAGDGRVLSRDDNVHRCDVSGNVRSLATPGTKPDTASNPEALEGMPHIRVVSDQGEAVSDANGDFTIAGATPPATVTVTYEGPFCDVVDAAGGDHAVGALLQQPSGNQIDMNPLGAPTVTAEANAFNWINNLRDWTRAVNPADGTGDFQALAFVNLPAPCNAFYDGVSVNFFIETACVNSAYSTVVVHEMGHWYNDLYGSGNGGDGFGEGNADVYAMYIVDEPIVGRDFAGPGAHIRSGNNNRQFCGDGNGGCYGEVHDDGEVLMGALWKVRANLESALGAPSGALAADTLFNAWMNAYNDGQIRSVIETRWLLLDDDDASLQNGTPNHAAIDGGFRAQGFPGHTPTCTAVASYCTSKTTSNGTLPVMGRTGTPSVADDDFAVTVTDAMPDKFGIFFYGSQSANVPFSGGRLCVAHPLTRTPVLSTDANGFASMPVPVDLSMIGTTRHYQFWFRDPVHPDGTTVGLSNGLRVGFCAD